MSIGRVDAIKCIRRVVARSRIRRRMGFYGCLRDEGIEAIGLMPHATLFEIFLSRWNVRKVPIEFEVRCALSCEAWEFREV